ncbi:glycosyltransferase [Candidatus Micrarchaeota archaeon]|nr:glycosyltransferase [Candidatus Micrarchaeota archaeon]MBU1165856.1 glycosyltransferase [Candidatus Micrarchaeota archaeon]MBU1887018.1 glycosyltransferase [Candidatus Micrarchaeota archaeon]
MQTKNTEKDLVTVIMPCYNQAQYARESIDSVLNQTHKNLEVLLIDNVSTDGTKEIVQEYEKKDPRVRAIYHKQNMGLGYSFTEGMKEAKGNFISFTSSDDIWYSTKVEEQLKLLENIPLADFCHTNANIIDGAGKKTGETIRQIYGATVEESSGDVLMAITRRNICCCASILFRRKCLETYAQFDPAFTVIHDWWFNIKIAQKHRFAYVSHSLVDYRVHEGNFSKKKTLLMEDYMHIHKRIADMGIEPQRHHIAIATSAARIGKTAEAKEAVQKAKGFGPLGIQDRIITFIINDFTNDSGAILEEINDVKHTLRKGWHMLTKG